MAAHTEIEFLHRGRYGRPDRYQVVPTCRYRVNGVEYYCRRMSFGSGGSGSREKCLGLAASYPPGREVPVYYDPQAPAVSVILPGVEVSNQAFIAAAGVAVILGLAILGWLAALLVRRLCRAA